MNYHRIWEFCVKVNCEIDIIKYNLKQRQKAFIDDLNYNDGNNAQRYCDDIKEMKSKIEMKEILLHNNLKNLPTAFFDIEL
jgi:hypothetical protein